MNSQNAASRKELLPKIFRILVPLQLGRQGIYAVDKNMVLIDKLMAKTYSYFLRALHNSKKNFLENKINFDMHLI